MFRRLRAFFRRNKVRPFCNGEVTTGRTAQRRCNGGVTAGTSVASEASQKNISIVEASLYNKEPTLQGIWKDIKAKDKKLPYDVIQYLDAVDAVCRAAEGQGRCALPRPYSKKDITELIVEIMEEFAEHPMSLLIYKSCMDTIALLSKFKRGMGSKLEAKVLQLAIKRTIDRGLRQQDVCNKVMYDQASSALNIMLRALLAEDPTWKHLQTILGHFTEFLDSEDPATKREALVMSSSLQRLADRCGIDCE